MLLQASLYLSPSFTWTWRTVHNVNMMLSWSVIVCHKNGIFSVEQYCLYFFVNHKYSYFHLISRRITPPWILHISFWSFRYSLGRICSNLCVPTCPLWRCSLLSILIFTLLLEVVYPFISIQMTHSQRFILDSMPFTKSKVKHFSMYTDLWYKWLNL